MASARIASSLVTPVEPGRDVSRRRFLLTLGGLAGAGLSAAWWGGELPRVRVDVMRPALGTWGWVVARHRDESLAGRAVEAAFAAIERVERQMSIHRPDSQLSRVNAAAGRSAVAVDDAVLEVMELAREGARRTGDLYDPTVLPLMKLYGFYDAPTRGLPGDHAIARVMERVGSRHVVLDRARGTLGLERSGAGLDLGSIGKGWAVDRAAAALREAGIADGLVDAGGNVYAFGAPEDGARGWSFGTLHPVTRRVERAVTVQARSAVLADRMSTAAYLLGPDRFGWPEAEAVHFVG